MAAAYFGQPDRSARFACATLAPMALPVTSELVERAAQGLAEGGWRYTRRQLYYAACAA
jgi:hypothetical protein